MQNSEQQQILIVDDAAENIDILGDALSDYKRMVAINGEKALELAMGNNPPDLILLDIVMPGMDGYEVCKRLKTNEKTREIPVIFLTAKTDTESVVKGFETGAIDYVTKPFNTSELLARVTTQLALKKSKDDIARYLKEIELKNKLINHSIRYAESIQNAVLPDMEFMKKEMPEHFVLFKPKDIVSGDFYWVKKISNFLIIAVVDCTGHGVPGAFMSMLGISFLNETVTKTKFDKANEILERLRKMVKVSLNQTGKYSEPRDGMDMALCILDLDNKEMQYAGAYNPLYLIRDGELIEYQADRQPVAIHCVEKEFTNHVIKLQEGDTFYIFSDGFYDQLGGTKYKKFLSKNFKTLLLEINKKSMDQQKDLLDKTLKEWMKNYEQIDDILVMGIRM